MLGQTEIKRCQGKYEPANLFSTATDAKAFGTLEHMVLIKAYAGR